MRCDACNPRHGRMASYLPNIAFQSGEAQSHTGKWQKNRCLQASRDFIHLFFCIKGINIFGQNHLCRETCNLYKATCSNLKVRLKCCLVCFSLRYLSGFCEFQMRSGLTAKLFLENPISRHDESGPLRAHFSQEEEVLAQAIKHVGREWLRLKGGRLFLHHPFRLLFARHAAQQSRCASKFATLHEI